MDERGQRGIQSLDAAGHLLLALGRSSAAMSLKDLANAAGMTASKAHPYLVSFTKLGLVRQDPTSARYDLGEQALRLGLTALQRLEPLGIAKTELAQMTPDGHFSVALASWANLGPTIVHFQEADYPLSVFIRTGTVLSLAYTASGLVFSTFMPPEVIADALSRDRYRLSGRPEELTMREMRRLTADVRRTGIGRNVGAAVPGVYSISAPIFNHDGQLALTVSFMRPGLSSEADPDGEAAQAARSCADRISARLGYEASRQRNTGDAAA